MRISDWSSDVCASDLVQLVQRLDVETHDAHVERAGDLVGALAHTGEHDALGRHAGVQRAAQFADRDDVGTDAGASHPLQDGDRKSVVEGKSVSVRVDLGGRRIIKKKNKNNQAA